jgi:starch synthase
MNIIHISSEVFPFSKTGGLADVAYALPKAQAKRGESVKVFTPLYKGLADKYELTDTGFRTVVNTPIGNFDFTVYRYISENFEMYFFSNSYFFYRKELYSENGFDYRDNYLRFGCFCVAAIHFADYYDISVDVFHIHDWQASFLPIFLKTEYKFIKTKVVLTIHNLAFQGIFDRSCLNVLKLPDFLYNINYLEYYGAINFLKGAVIFSDYITTVSPTYANEIMDVRFGYGLEGVVKANKHKIKGILNGIDYDIWNPEQDNKIKKNYSKNTFKNKYINKKELTKNFFLDDNLPLFIFISRFTSQKGADVLAELLEIQEVADACFAILGDGTKEISDRYKSLSLNRNNIFVYTGFNEELAHQLYAAGDFLLMPSRFEPCGLSQLIAMKYGTIPIVNSTGGLKDTVIDIKNDGYGFIIDEVSTNILYYTIKRAIHLYKQKKQMERIAKKCMDLNFSWTKSADEYINLYKDITYRS